MLFGYQPGLMGQQFIDLVKVSQLAGCVFQPLQPLWVATVTQEVLLVKLYQICTVVSCCSLEETEKYITEAK